MPMLHLQDILGAADALGHPADGLAGEGMGSRS